MDHICNVRGSYKKDDNYLEVLAADTRKNPAKSWWEYELPKCPDCGGDVVWWEAGFVPGTRKCVGKPVKTKDGDEEHILENGCGSLFSVREEEFRLIFRRERFYTQ